MPIVSVERIGADVQMGVWRMEDTAEALVTAHPQLEPVLDMAAAYRSTARRLEVLAVHALLFHLTGDTTLRIGHDARGVPLVPGWQISLSHTRGFATVILSRRHRVAVDIEYRSDRVERIADRFIRTDEKAEDLRSKLIHWSVKETVYKLFTEEDLKFFDMRLHPLVPGDEGRVQVEDLLCPKVLEVAYRYGADYVLTYAYL